MKIVQAEIVLSELVREDADWRWARGGGGKKHCFIVKLTSESGLGYAGITDVLPVDQRYKKYFGQETVEAVKAEQDLFNRLFLKK